MLMSKIWVYWTGFGLPWMSPQTMQKGYSCIIVLIYLVYNDGFKKYH